MLMEARTVWRCLAKVQIKVILTNSEGWMAMPMMGTVSQLLLAVSIPAPVSPATRVRPRSPTEKISMNIQSRSTMRW